MLINSISCSLHVFLIITFRCMNCPSQSQRPRIASQNLGHHGGCMRVFIVFCFLLLSAKMGTKIVRVVAFSIYPNYVRNIKFHMLVKTSEFGF
nr:hypothetical protein BSM_17790 [uncultured archaeon]